MPADSERSRYERALQAYQQGDISTAIERLKLLIADFPEKDQYRIALANLYLGSQTPEAACELFSTKDPDNCYNQAYYAAKAGMVERAISLYEQSIDMGLQHPAEAYNNIAILQREEILDDDMAEATFKLAVELAPGYAAAIINLANLYEDRGEKEQAKQLLLSIPQDDKQYPTGLTRLAAMQRDGSMLTTLKDCLARTQSDPDQHCNMLYEIGHQLEASKQYEEAWQAFQAANALNARFNRAFNPKWWRARFEEAIQPVTNQAISTEHNLVFICGMFRSGSTLLEQMLAAHPAIAAGGELTLFPKLAQGLNPSKQQQAVSQYLQQISRVANDKPWVTDKRPDNLWHIHKIKQLFPKAKIVITERYLRDNALSIYQQRLAPAMDYACNPQHIVEYAEYCQALKEHWQKFYPEDVYIVHYEALVKDPQATITPILREMGLAWDDACLRFHTLNNTVKTASVWQVRQALHNQSIGRAKHYPAFLPERDA